MTTKLLPIGTFAFVGMVAAILFASSTPGQVRAQSFWLFSQEERPVAKLFDEYAGIRFNDEKARLDNFAIQLQTDPGADGHIIGYGGNICRQGEALARAKRAKDYLYHSRGIDPERIVTRNGGYRDVVGNELYVVPNGAPEPAARPKIQKCRRPKSR